MGTKNHAGQDVLGQFLNQDMFRNVYIQTK